MLASHMSPAFASSTSAAVIGAGTMGNGNAQVAANEIDTAMRLGKSYPRGPLVWGGEPGATFVATVLGNFDANHGDTRYRESHLLRRLSVNGGKFHD